MAVRGRYRKKKHSDVMRYCNPNKSEIMIRKRRPVEPGQSSCALDTCLLKRNTAANRANGNQNELLQGICRGASIISFYRSFKVALPDSVSRYISRFVLPTTTALNQCCLHSNTEQYTEYQMRMILRRLVKSSSILCARFYFSLLSGFQLRSRFDSIRGVCA